MTVYTTLSSRSRQGLCEVLIRCTISRDNRPRFKTGIYVRPGQLIDGIIWSDKRAEASECRKKNAELNKFIEALQHIVEAGEHALKVKNPHALEMFGKDGRISTDWINKVFELSNRHADAKDHILLSADFGMVWQMMEADARVQALQDAETRRVEEERARQEAEAAEAARLAEEARLAEAEKKDIFTLVDEYVETHHLSVPRAKMYRVLSGMLYRFELYRQKIEGVEGYRYDYDIVSIDDVRDFRDYITDEPKIKEAHPDAFAEIEAETWQKFGLVKQRAISSEHNARGGNYLYDMMKKIKTIHRWLVSRHITSNNPFNDQEAGEFGNELYGAPIYISRDERDAITYFDLSSRPQLAVQRDIFVFQCLTGCRVGDLYRLSSKNIDGSVFSYRPRKTTDNRNSPEPKFVLHPLAIEIANRYKGVDPKGRLLPFISEQNYNQAIKEIFKICGITRNVIIKDPTTREDKLVPIDSVASSHMARRVFVGSLIRLTKDPNLVGQMSGHVQGSAAISRYYKYATEETEELTSKM